MEHSTKDTEADGFELLGDAVERVVSQAGKKKDGGRCFFQSSVSATPPVNANDNGGGGLRRAETSKCHPRSEIASVSVGNGAPRPTRERMKAGTPPPLRPRD